MTMRFICTKCWLRICYLVVAESRDFKSKSFQYQVCVRSNSRRILSLYHHDSNSCIDIVTTYIVLRFYDNTSINCLSTTTTVIRSFRFLWSHIRTELDTKHKIHESSRIQDCEDLDERDIQISTCEKRHFIEFSSDNNSMTSKKK